MDLHWSRGSCYPTFKLVKDRHGLFLNQLSENIVVYHKAMFITKHVSGDHIVLWHLSVRTLGQKAKGHLQMHQGDSNL